MFCQTVPAGSEEHELTGVNLSSDVLCRFAAQPLGCIHLVQVHNRRTAVADKMHVGRGVGIEPFDPVDSAKALDEALILEPGEVSVHRCQRCPDGRVSACHAPSPQRGGYPFPADRPESHCACGIAWYCVPWAPPVLLYLRITLIYKLSIPWRFLFVNRKMRIICIYFQISCRLFMDHPGIAVGSAASSGVPVKLPIFIPISVS